MQRETSDSGRRMLNGRSGEMRSGEGTWERSSHEKDMRVNLKRRAPHRINAEHHGMERHGNHKRFTKNG